MSFAALTVGGDDNSAAGALSLGGTVNWHAFLDRY
jgi:hypothetical protein